MTALASPDTRINAPWGCQACGAKFRLGNAIFLDNTISGRLVYCPHCGSADLAPLIDHEAIELSQLTAERRVLQ